MIKLKFPTAMKAWEGMNEFMVYREKYVKEKGGAVYGSQFLAYELNISIVKAEVDPDFDFNKVLGYTSKKWTSLVVNYVDMQQLDLVRVKVAEKENKPAPQYSIPFYFSNKQGSGKGCLVSAVFSKRPNKDVPVAVFHVRAAEATKRFIMDLLLYQRIIEYVYGHNNIEILLMYPSFYISSETVTLYDIHKPFSSIDEKRKERYPGEQELFYERVFRRLEKFQEIEPETESYKSNQRIAEQLQGLRPKVPLYAKDLQLIPEQNEEV